MRKEYQEELENLRTKMEKAELFAQKLPVFSEVILDNKITGEEEWVNFGDRYKKIYFGWGIKRGFYRNGGARYVSNFPKDKEYNHHLFNIYINCYSLFYCHEDFGLYDYLNNVNVFFADKLNSTFYIEDEHIEAFLEAVNIWYVDACKKLEEKRRHDKIAKLRAELEKEIGEPEANQTAEG